MKSVITDLTYSAYRVEIIATIFNPLARKQNAIGILLGHSIRGQSVKGTIMRRQRRKAGSRCNAPRHVLWFQIGNQLPKWNFGG
jgi:hypothetical protein